MSSKEKKLISRIRITCNVVPRILKDKQIKIFVVFEILANVLLTFNKLVIKAKMHAKTLFFGVWKTQYDFFSFKTLGRMHKNIFF
jgi:hypothetical protein